jgi:importin-7
VRTRLWLQHQYLSPRVVNLLLQYLTHALKLSKSWVAVKPEVPLLLEHVVFPLMCFSDEDKELWQDDPQEYIRKVGAPSCGAGWPRLGLCAND